MATLVGTVRADSTAPLPPSSSSSSPVGLHAEPAVFAGTLHGDWLIGAGLAIGLRVRLPGGFDVRLGPTVSTFQVGGRGSGSYGGEVQVDRVTRRGWRIGGRVAMTRSGNDGCTECGDGTWLEAGPRFRVGSAILGADLLWVRGRDDTHAFGLRAHAALGGRAGQVVGATTAIFMAVAVTVLIVSLGRS